MTIQKIASKIKTVVTLVAASRGPGANTSSAITLSSFGYPRTARLIVSGTATGGTLDGYLTDDSTGSHTKITGSDITQMSSATTEYGPEVKIRSGATEVKSVITSAVFTEGFCGIVELGDKSYEV